MPTLSTVFDPQVVNRFFDCLNFWKPEKTVLLKEMLIQYPSIERALHPKYGLSLYYAIVMKSVEDFPSEVVHELIRIPGLIDYQDEQGRTSLYRLMLPYIKWHAQTVCSFHWMMPPMVEHLNELFSYIRYIIVNGADTNLADNEGIAPVHLWAMNRSEERVLTELLAHGANINQQDLLGRTALHYAPMDTDMLPWRIMETTRVLIAHGADETITDLDGRTPKDVLLQTTAKMLALLGQ